MKRLVSRTEYIWFDSSRSIVVRTFCEFSSAFEDYVDEIGYGCVDFIGRYTHEWTVLLMKSIDDLWKIPFDLMVDAPPVCY